LIPRSLLPLRSVLALMGEKATTTEPYTNPASE
jgi:hypothetical protein